MDKPIGPPPIFCSIATVAKNLDCGETTVRDYVNRGLLPKPTKIGGMARWKWIEIERAMDQAQIGAPPGQGADAANATDPIMLKINGR
ncbi:MAG: helix-turn-helix domain-containing protein [Rhodobacteraceae bacterium]|nr:helix-turn-helix domain-containing protein [Paracoccaceae bacterium]